MKRKRDIFDLIRDNEHRLSERPSPRTWRRLESKLDARHNKNRTFLYKQLAMVAAVVALVAVAALFAILVDRKSEQFASADNSAQSWVVQDLEPIYTETDLNMKKVVEFQKTLTSRYTTPIEEGSQAKKLLASHQVNQRINQTPNRTEDVSETAIALNERPSAAPQTTDNQPYTYAYSNNSPNTAATTTEVMEEAGIAPSAPLADAEASFKTAKKQATTNQSMRTTASKSKAASLQNFDWIIGKWKDSGAVGLAFEDWKKVNATTFSGNGFLMKNGKVDFVENLKIEKIGNDWFYILQMDNNKNTAKFKLISVAQNEFVFTNSNKTFPNKIILKKNDNNTFSTTLLHQNNSKLTSDQKDFFNKRNKINNQKATRILIKK